jgi:hypothetical protein
MPGALLYFFDRSGFVVKEELELGKLGTQLPDFSSKLVVCSNLEVEATGGA